MIRRERDRKEDGQTSPVKAQEQATAAPLVERVEINGAVGSNEQQPSPAQSEARGVNHSPGCEPAMLTNVPPYPGISESARIRLRAVLWRAAIELGQGHPARRHLDAIADDPPQSTGSPTGQALASITATLRQMHTKEETLKHLSEAADILAGRR